MEGLVPNSAGLLHPINAFHQVHDPLLLSQDFKSRRLLHKHGFILGKYAMKESGFDVELLQFPIEGGSDVQDGLNGLHVDGGGSCFIVVNPIALCKTFSDVPNLVADNLSSVIAFAFTDEFPFEGMVSARDVRPWYKDMSLALKTHTARSG